MSEYCSVTLKKATALIATGLSLFLLVYGVRHCKKIMEKLRLVFNSNYPLKHKRIEIVENLDDCQKVVNILKLHTASYKIIGFDCEWVHSNGRRQPVALLQLASLQGCCGLFRLCKLKEVPASLRELLEDKHLIKVGVASIEDAKKLTSDYGVQMYGAFDLRFMATMAGKEPLGLGKMAHALLNVEMDKAWRVTCSNWEAKELTEQQQHYAADDALVAVEIFFKLSRILEPEAVNFLSNRFCNLDAVKNRIQNYYDVVFKNSFFLPSMNMDIKDTKNPFWRKSDKVMQSWIKMKRKLSETQKPFYHNCLLEAPDGDLLCTIDFKRASWYTSQDLGTVICEDPYTVRLKFEPSGRAVGDVGRFYQQPKIDQCVVCGNRRIYTRKNIVPREYRRHFPDVMKQHTSHDILLLCPSCHYLSDLSNNPIKERLAVECNAPIKFNELTAKFHDIKTLRNVRKAGRTLLHHYPRLPQFRKDEYETIIKEYFNVTEITKEILDAAEALDSRVLNADFVEHGQKVVEVYRKEKGGLIALEKLWRLHFLNTMKPRFLPDLWNVNHNEDRLILRAQEGRISEEELRAAGIKTTIQKPDPRRGHPNAKRGRKYNQVNQQNGNIANNENNQVDQNIQTNQINQNNENNLNNENVEIKEELRVVINEDMSECIEIKAEIDLNEAMEIQQEINREMPFNCDMEIQEEIIQYDDDMENKENILIDQEQDIQIEQEILFAETMNILPFANEMEILRNDDDILDIDELHGNQFIMDIKTE